jgi:hypothetical protein
MSHTKLLPLLPALVVLLAAGDHPWADKAIPDWNDDDTRLILNDSPWAKAVQPIVDSSTGNGQRQSRGMGRGGGINLGGIGIGLPGMGRRGGGGYPGAGNPGGQAGGNGGSTAAGQPPSLRLRWESALPIRKAHEANSPTVDEGHYAVAVYGVPDHLVSAAGQGLASQLRKEAAIKRNNKPDLKPSSVDILQREDGPLIVYFFPRSNEITRQDSRIEFDAKIGSLKFTQAFIVDDMVYQGKLEM